VIVAAVALLGDFGVLAVMVGNRDYSRVGHARYLMHTFILGDLAARGVRHLIAGSVLRESQGNQYFQRLLGYRVCNVRPILLAPSGDRRAAAARRLLMRGQAVANADRPSRDDSRRITSSASAHVSHPEQEAMRDIDDPRGGAEVAVTTGSVKPGIRSVERILRFLGP
jgi:hypothetical protein